LGREKSLTKKGVAKKSHFQEESESKRGLCREKPAVKEKGKNQLKGVIEKLERETGNC